MEQHLNLNQKFKINSELEVAIGLNNYQRYFITTNLDANAQICMNTLDDNIESFCNHFYNIYFYSFMKKYWRYHI